MGIDRDDPWLSSGNLSIWILPTQDRNVRMCLSGELDMASAGRLEVVLEGVLGRRPSRIEIDLTEIRFVDSTGLRVLLAASMTTAQPIVLCGLPPMVHRVLETAGVADRFVIEDVCS